MAAFHEERALLYEAIAHILLEEADAHWARTITQRLERVSGGQARARALVEDALRDSERIERCSAWLRSAATGLVADIDALAVFARGARRCARALDENDMAMAADAWDAQRADLDGELGAILQALAGELSGAHEAAVAALGIALDMLLRDDLVLVRLSA